MPPETGKLSFVEKAGYSLGDAAANFVFMTMILFQLNFYTDTLGISAAAAGTMLLVGRLWDAFFDPMMGVIADRTNTRWGKFRPWVLWTAIPWGVVLIAAYSVPNFPPMGRLLWAGLTNILLMTLYSMNNTPYSAMSGVMTGDVNERTSLSSYRFVAAMLAQLIVGGFTLPLVAKFGQGNNAKGWQLTMALWAVVCVVCFVITFVTTRERIVPEKKQTADAKGDFKSLLNNGPWIAMFVLTLAHFVFVAMHGGTTFYYFQYYVDRPALLAFLQDHGMVLTNSGGFWSSLLDKLGLVLNADQSNLSSVGFSLYNISSKIVTVVGVVASTWLAMKYGKRAVAIIGFSLATILMASFILLPSNAIGATFLLEWARALCYAPTIPLIWAMFADVADYAEWKTSRRTTGVIFATILFALKTGLSLGGAIAGWLLSAYGYQANVAQTPEALLGIRLTISVYPAVFLVIVVICLFSYKITKKLNLQIQDELAQREKSYVSHGRIGTMRNPSISRFTAVLAAMSLVLPALSACARTNAVNGGDVTAPKAAASGAPLLKTVFRNDFMVGAALNPDQFEGRDVAGAGVVKSHFNTITPENVLKWEQVHPELGRYNFEPADKYVEFGVKNGMFVVGHTLVWHSQMPRAVFLDATGKAVSRDTLLARMRDHIRTVVGRYKGRIKGWDVVNEALEEDGTLRKSQWLNIIGDDFIAKAFQYAHEADPNAELYYNDYSLENPAKRAGAVKLIQGLQAQGIKVHAIGMQGHMKMDWPTVGLEDSTITMFAALGVRVNVSELDVDVLPSPTGNRGADVSARAEGSARFNPYAAGLPDSVSKALARRYGDLFEVYLKHRDVMDRITFWGVADGDSWLNGWPVRGRTSYPLLFDRQHMPKPAFQAIIDAAMRRTLRQ